MDRPTILPDIPDISQQVQFCLTFERLQCTRTHQTYTPKNASIKEMPLMPPNDAVDSAPKIALYQTTDSYSAALQYGYG
jgi:hypothetical protein